MNLCSAPRSIRTAALLLAVAMLATLAACSSKTKGPDLAAELDGISSLTKAATPPEGLDLQGADGTWLSAGSGTEVADVISAQVRPDERNDSAQGDTFLLYRSGTLWLTQSGDQTAVILYKDNDAAYRRHSGVLLLGTGWGSRMRSYDSGGGSSGSGGNSFRGGGSGSGK